MPATASKQTTTLKIGRHNVPISNSNKILYPSANFTKGQVIDYYARITPALMPHLKNRPLTLKRYPNGVDGPFFYEKMCPSHRPEWVATTRVKTTNRDIDFCLVNDPATLVWVANLASLELHTLLARAPDLTRPTFMVFDHDPGEGTGLLECCKVALRFRDLLANLGLQSFPKTSGGKGLHLYVPLNTKVNFDQTKAFSHAVAGLMEREDPAHITTVMRKDLRKGKVFLDWSQNDDHKTTVCVYSLRARQKPTVSTPVTWDEVEKAVKKKDATPLIFESQDTLRRVDKLGDLFEPVLKVKQKLPSV
jgi:bifunctional non-homologous end joining protein LigD